MPCMLRLFPQWTSAVVISHFGYCPPWTTGMVIAPLGHLLWLYSRGHRLLLFPPWTSAWNFLENVRLLVLLLLLSRVRNALHRVYRTLLQVCLSTLHIRLHEAGAVTQTIVCSHLYHTCGQTCRRCESHPRRIGRSSITYCAVFWLSQDTNHPLGLTDEPSTYSNQWLVVCKEGGAWSHGSATTSAHLASITKADMLFKKKWVLKDLLSWKK